MRFFRTNIFILHTLSSTDVKKIKVYIYQGVADGVLVLVLVCDAVCVGVFVFDFVLVGVCVAVGV